MVWGKSVTEERLALYLQATSSVPTHWLEQGIAMLEHSEEFLPVPAKIIKAAKTVAGLKVMHRAPGGYTEHWLPWNHRPEPAPPEMQVDMLSSDTLSTIFAAAKGVREALRLPATIWARNYSLAIACEELGCDSIVEPETEERARRDYADWQAATTVRADSHEEGGPRP